MQKYIEKSDSGLRTESDKDGYDKAFSSYTNNSGESLGAKFKRIEQGTSIESTYIQTRPSLVSGYDTSGTVRIDFDMAKSYTTSTVTVIGVQGDMQSGTSNTYSEDAQFQIANEQWLFSFEDALIYGYNTSSWPTIEAHTNRVWDKFSLVINCATDTYDVYRNGSKIINGYGVGVNFNNINSLKVVTKKSGPSGKKLETLIDNIRFYVGSSSSGWTQVFYEDFEDDDMKVIDKGESGYRTGSDTDGNGTQFSGYTNNSGDSLGTQFKRLAQGKDVSSRFIQTRPSLTSGYDTSGKVKFEFDMAKSNTANTITVIAVQGDVASGTTNSEAAAAHYNNEQWLYSVESGETWAATPTINNDWTQTGTYTTPNSWEKYTLIIDCDTDTYDVYVNGVQKTSGYGIGVDFNNIDSLKVVTKKKNAGTSGVAYETLVDNIGFYKETAPGTWTEIFFEDFEASDKQFIESGNSGYRIPTDADGNKKVYNTYPNAMGINVGTQFKRIEQGKGIGKKYIQTDPDLLTGYDTSVVKVAFDLAMSETYKPLTIISVQGDVESGTTNTYDEYLVSNEQWLFSIEEDRIYGFNGGTSWPQATDENSKMKQKWYHFELVVNCVTDTYELWYSDNKSYLTKVINGNNIGMDFNNINSFKILTKPSSYTPDIVSETLVDNIVISVAYPETEPVIDVGTFDNTSTGLDTPLTEKYGIAKFSTNLESDKDYAIVASDGSETKVFDIDFGANDIEVGGLASFFTIIWGDHDITSINLVSVEK